MPPPPLTILTLPPHLLLLHPAPPSPAPSDPLPLLLSLYPGRFLLCLLYHSRCGKEGEEGEEEEGREVEGPDLYDSDLAAEFLAANPDTAGPYALPLLATLRKNPRHFVAWFLSLLDNLAHLIQPRSPSLPSPPVLYPLTLLPFLTTLLTIPPHLPTETLLTLLRASLPVGMEGEEGVPRDGVRVLLEEFVEGVAGILSEVA